MPFLLTEGRKGEYLEEGQTPRAEPAAICTMHLIRATRAFLLRQ
jgi:hypothetical protein